MANVEVETAEVERENATEKEAWVRASRHFRLCEVVLLVAAWSALLT